MDTSMEAVQIPQSELTHFKEKVKRWLMLDIQISEMESKLRDLKKIRNKEIEPQLTEFMVQYNITDLNTETGKLKCSAKNTKKGLNKDNIKMNLSKVISDIGVVEKAMEQLENREVTTTYKLTKVKAK
jgi:hypothetical protein|tara:strand:+ start:724 stop:1107 length:384 start_codon:yes stop_codon:yes gene_type:complete